MKPAATVIPCRKKAKTYFLLFLWSILVVQLSSCIWAATLHLHTVGAVVQVLCAYIDSKRTTLQTSLVGITVGNINKVNRCSACLIQTSEPSQYVTSHPGQLSLAIPPWVGAMSTSESWDVNRHTARCTSPVSVVWQCKLVSGWGRKSQRSAPLYVPCGSEMTIRFTHISSRS